MESVSRLISPFAPEHYDLSITLKRTDRTFDGTVTIRGEVLTDTKEIRLHSKALSIASATFDGKEASFKEDAHDELVISHPDMALGTHNIVITFSGSITDDMNGIYPGYFEVEGKKQELLATQVRKPLRSPGLSVYRRTRS